jgi:hypothetical protein
MPRKTKETALPKPAAPHIDWVTIAGSGRVWEFREGEDFTGKLASFRARKKTEARKAGIDFDSVEAQRAGKSILKILAFPITSNPATAAPAKARRAIAKVTTEREPDPQLFAA